MDNSPTPPPPRSDDLFIENLFNYIKQKFLDDNVVFIDYKVGTVPGMLLEIRGNKVDLSIPHIGKLKLVPYKSTDKYFCPVARSLSILKRYESNSISSTPVKRCSCDHSEDSLIRFVGDSIDDALSARRITMFSKLQFSCSRKCDDSVNKFNYWMWNCKFFS